MSRLRDALSENNQRRLTACQTRAMEIFKWPEMPDEEIIISLALILFNLVLKCAAKGWINMFITSPATRDGTRYNLINFFLVNYDDLEKRRSEKQKPTVN